MGKGFGMAKLVGAVDCMRIERRDGRAQSRTYKSTGAKEGSGQGNVRRYKKNTRTDHQSEAGA